MTLDLVLRGGRIIDPSQGIDATLDVGFRDGRVAQTGVGLTGDTVKHVSGLIVTPGPIDLHTHVYWAAPRWASTRCGSRGVAARRSSIREARGRATTPAFSTM